MRAYRILCVIAALLAAAPAAVAAKKALCIGNTTYGHIPSLRNSGNDATDIGNALKRLGFQVTIKLDLDLRKIESALQEFSGSIREGDTAFFFYAGHGIQVEGVNYLVPVEMEVAGQKRADVRYHAFDAGRVLETMMRAQPALTVMILDACRNDPFGSRGMGVGLSPMEAALGTVIVYSTGAGRTSSDGTGRNGLFTQHFLQQIGDKRPFTDIIRNVREKVFEASGHEQRPYLQEDVIGDFFLAGRGEESVARLTEPDPQPRVERIQAPGSGESALDKGLRLYQTKRYEEAARAFEEARRADPENAFAQNAAGVALVALGRFAPAVPCFNAAIRLKPNYAAAFVNRGLAYLKSSKYEQAEADFDWAIGEEQDNPLAYVWRAKARLGLREKAQDALEDLDKALQLDQGLAEAWRLRGLARYRMRAYPESLADLNQAVQIAPGDPEIYAVRAATLRALGRSAESASDDRTADRLREKGGKSSGQTPGDSRRL